MMDILRKNVFSISCAVVALLTLVFVHVWPMPGWYDQLQQNMRTSVTAYDEINSLMTRRFTKPNVDPAQLEPEPLGQFPNAATIQKGLEIVEKLKAQTAAMRKAAMDMNEHKPLVASALPTGRGQAYSHFKFGYYRQLEEFRAAMNAITAPTPEEVAAEAERLRIQEYEPRIQKVGGTEPNRAEVEALFEQHRLRLPDEMRLSRAKQFTVFLSDRTTLDTCLGIMPAAETTDLLTDPIGIWAVQLSLWIEEDVVAAIVETNRAVPNANVESAIVKRLVYLDIPKRYIGQKGDITLLEGQQNRGPAAGAGARGFGPSPYQLQMMQAQRRNTIVDAAEEPTEATPDTKVFTASPTGRVCNSMYDVVHFTVVVDADAREFRKFLHNLTRTRFITILSADIIGVDREREQWRGFMYGGNPVARVRLNCEAIFFRNWTVKYMPPAVQKLLGIPQPGAADATAGL